MSYRRTLKMLVVAVALLVIGGNIVAQQVLPVPPAGPIATAETSSLNTGSSVRGIRADGTFLVSYYWYANNPNLPWNGNNISYSFADFGPATSGIAYIDYGSTRGTCTIQNAGADVLCNFGSSIPGHVIVYVDFLIQFADTIDWFVVEAASGGGSSVYTYVTDPFPYSTNIVPDPSFEIQGLPSWNLVPGAKRACNKVLVTVSYDADCALQVKPQGQASLNLTLPETYDAGDVIWVGWYGASKNVQNFTKLIVISKSLAGQKSKTVWRMEQGTSDYSFKYINHRVPANSNKVTLKVVGPASGKSWTDLLGLLPVDFADVN